MSIEITTGPLEELEEYQQVSIAFEVRSRFRILPVERGLGGLLLVEEAVSPAYVKDYDAIEGERPVDWASKWDIAGWGMVRARDGNGQLGGGAVVALETPGLEMLVGRHGRAALWDLRVRPELRGQGVGRALFAAAADWARQIGAGELYIETQDVNVPACRFYAAQGCTLAGIRQEAYEQCPGEAELMWRLALR